MDNLKMHTPDLAEANFRKLAALFPNAVTETVNEAGETVRAIDADVLRQEISAAVVEGPQERYQFTWPDKKKSVVLANAPIAKTLRLDRSRSVSRDGTRGGVDTENIYIEGDNLDALKLLQETYLGKVKMIYIDPPYNTGSDFIYEDDFSRETGEYLADSGQFDEEGNRLVQNTESNGRFHTDWLNMLYPRLRIAKDFLADDGVIFISIDDNELNNIISCGREIFGPGGHIATFVWEKRKTRENRKILSTRHDYIVCFVKNYEKRTEAIGLEPMDDDAIDRYKNPDNDPRGVWTSVPAIAQSGHGTKSQFYTLKSPKGFSFDPPSGACWRYTKEKMQEAISDNRIWFGADGSGVPRIKKFLTEGKQGLTPETMLFSDKVGTNDTAKRELVSLFDGIAVFETPKPVALIQHFLKICNHSSDTICMDFFSGTATTAHAVMQLNAEDGGHRKFIMVQLPEPCGEKSEARKAGYKTICDIGEERLRRAGDKIRAETGAEIDYGFRVFRVDSSNMEDVYYAPVGYDQSQLDLLADNIKPDRTPEDLLFQVMLDLGIPLSGAIEETVIAGKRVFSVAGGYLLACFDSAVAEETVTEIAKRRPFYAVLRDSSLAADSVAANFEQIFAAYSPKTVRKVL